MVLAVPLLQPEQETVWLDVTTSWAGPESESWIDVGATLLELKEIMIGK